MTEAELVDLEECSQMFDFSGFAPDEDRRLLAEVRRLRQERDEAIAERDFRRSRLVLCANLQVDVHQLREALKRYGKHQILDCALYSAARRGPDAVCTCGLDAALAGEG